jgi:hypothetical protein
MKIDSDDPMSRDIYGDLRDFFAAHALTAIVQVDDYDNGTYARKAYDIADSMMNEREKRYGIAYRQEQAENLQ